MSSERAGGATFRPAFIPTLSTRCQIQNRHRYAAVPGISRIARDQWLAIGDIDHFKRVNDTFGHDTGDRVINAVARSLARLTDDKCHAARHGGEEFVMLFRGISLDEAKARLDTARETLGNRRFVKEASDEVIGLVTFSGGIADVFGHDSPRLALRAADGSLYRAKEQGRNRICVTGE